jgi:hypothetical protein
MGWRGGQNLLALSANPDILRMVIGRLCMQIANGTATVLCKVKSHRGEPLNETVDDLADLGRTIDPEHAVWTTRSNRMVFSWIDGQKKCTYVNMEPKSAGQSAAGSWTIQI